MMTKLGHQFRRALSMTIVLMVITGLIYPGIVTGTAQLIFPWRANGSLVSHNGAIVGSSLIGQQFVDPWYFHSRPSAAGDGYDATASGGTNLGPTDARLADTLIARAVARAISSDGAVRGSVPADMVTASASGLDPDISPANAALQVDRVARARRVDPARVSALVARIRQNRQFGVLGEPRVNVLELNLALENAFPRVVQH